MRSVSKSASGAAGAGAGAGAGSGAAAAGASAAGAGAGVGVLTSLPPHAAIIVSDIIHISTIAIAFFILIIPPYFCYRSKNNPQM